MIPEEEGQHLFGEYPSEYHKSRPEYPSWVFDTLREKGYLYEGATALEAGSGTGIATQQLSTTPLSQLTLIEPDKRFAPYLTRLSDINAFNTEILYQPFEAVNLSASFDLILIATAFHWLDPATRIEKLAKLTKSGGVSVLIWNVFQNLNLEDPFHEATKDLLAPLTASPSGEPDVIPFALDRKSREEEFLAGGYFSLEMYWEDHWALTLDPGGVRSLYSGFSQIARLPENPRNVILNELEHIAETKFSGKVVRNMTTPMYVLRRV